MELVDLEGIKSGRCLNILQETIMQCRESFCFDFWFFQKADS